MAFCSFLFVCLYLIQIHISEPISTDLGTRLPLRLEKVVGYVWTHNIPPFLPFRSLFSRAGAAFCTDDGCRFQVLPLNRDSRTRVCDVTGVTFAELLHRLANPHSHVRVCVASTRVYMRMSGSFSPRFVVTAHSGVCVVVCFYHRVVTYSRHFVLRYLHKTFFCRLLSAFRRLRPLTCVCVCVCVSTLAWLHIPEILIFAISTHSVLTHLSLSNTHFCSCCHCHFSRHATQKKLFPLAECLLPLQRSPS